MHEVNPLSPDTPIAHDNGACASATGVRWKFATLHRLRFSASLAVLSMRRIESRWLILPVALLALGAIWFWRTNRIQVERAVIDGHAIAYARQGAGSPALVFIYGGFGGGPGKIESWNAWMSRFDTTAFTYERPGSGNSEFAKDQRTPAQIVGELHALLTRVGIFPPYILVGRSLGGLYSRAFAIRYPHDVAGLVLIDGSHERQWIEMSRLDPAGQLLPPPSNPDWKKPDFVGLIPTMKSGQLDIGGNLPDVPMAVLTSVHHGAGKEAVPPEAEKIWLKLQDEFLQSTTHGNHIVTEKSGHDIAHDEPELVTNAIRWVLDAARRLPKPTAPH
jgi:pimeloyl-ACP methyl ester carboxylesterase